MAHARKKSEKHCEVSEYFHSLFSCILCATQRGDIKHLRVASLVRRGAVLHLLHRHTPVAEAGGGVQLILGWRSFNVGTTARINHTALFFHGVCFVLFLCSFGNISGGDSSSANTALFRRSD